MESIPLLETIPSLESIPLPESIPDLNQLNCGMELELESLNSKKCPKSGSGIDSTAGIITPLEDSLVGWFCQLADDFLFVMNVLWLLLSLKVGHTAPPHIVSTSAEFGSSQAILAPVSLWTHSWQVMANLVNMKGFKIFQHSNNI